MTTTRRRSSVGSTATVAQAAAAPDPPAGASTPGSAAGSPRRSSRRRTSLLVRRESDALDLGLLSRASPSPSLSVSATPSSRRAFRFFDDDDDDEDGGLLLPGGRRVKPAHALASVLLLALFSILTLLTLYPGVSEGLSKDVSHTIPCASQPPASVRIRGHASDTFFIMHPTAPHPHNTALLQGPTAPRRQRHPRRVRDNLITY